MSPIDRAKNLVRSRLDFTQHHTSGTVNEFSLPDKGNFFLFCLIGYYDRTRNKNTMQTIAIRLGMHACMIWIHGCYTQLCILVHLIIYMHAGPRLGQKSFTWSILSIGVTSMLYMQRYSVSLLPYSCHPISIVYHTCTHTHIYTHRCASIPALLIPIFFSIQQKVPYTMYMY